MKKVRSCGLFSAHPKKYGDSRNSMVKIRSSGSAKARCCIFNAQNCGKVHRNDKSGLCTPVIWLLRRFGCETLKSQCPKRGKSASKSPVRRMAPRPQRSRRHITLERLESRRRKWQNLRNRGDGYHCSAEFIRNPVSKCSAITAVSQYLDKMYTEWIFLF